MPIDETGGTLFVLMAKIHNNRLKNEQMKQYFCLSECGTIAIYKSNTMSRLYRLEYPGKHKGMHLLTYKKESNAQKVCDHTESIGNGIFKPTILNN